MGDARLRVLAAAAVLAARPGCGGSGAFNPALAPYVAMARRADCADRVNRLYWIDRQLVFWRREGSCVDAAWFHALYDGTSLDPLCIADDSIGGPRQACRDAGARRRTWACCPATPWSWSSAGDGALAEP